MPFPSPARRDYRYWPTKERVTLHFGGTGTADDIHELLAMRDQPQTRSEKAPSGAEYLVSRTKWYVPGPLLPRGTLLYPGDQVTADLVFRRPDEGTGTWTVLEASQNHLDEVWSLDCQMLSLHPRLSTTVTIQRPVLDSDGRLPKDSTGAEVWTWQNVYVDEPAAVVKQDSQGDVELDGQLGARERYLIVVGRVLTITNLDRVLLNHVGTGTDIEEGVFCLDVDNYQDTDLIDELPHLVCSRQP